jgi:hypothetical protein
MASVFKTARVSAAYIRVGNVGPTLSDALALSLDAPFGIVQTYVEEPGEEPSFKRCSDRRVCPSSYEGGFDGKALRVSTVLRGPAKNLSSRRESSLLRSFRINSLAIASGSSRLLRPSNSTCRIRLLLPEPFGPAKIVRTGTPQAAVPSSSRLTR